MRVYAVACKNGVLHRGKTRWLHLRSAAAHEDRRFLNDVYHYNALNCGPHKVIALVPEERRKG